MPGRCGRCHKDVYSAEERLGLGKSWHIRCFTCAICFRSLDSWTLAENRELNEIFCKTCYRINFATKGYGYGANEPTLLALPQGTRSSSSSSLIVGGSRTTNYNQFNGDSTVLKNVNVSQYPRPTTTKQEQDCTISKYGSETFAVTKTVKHKGHRHTHRNSQDHNNNNKNQNQIINKVNENVHHEHHHRHHHRHKHKQKQCSPSPPVSSSHSSASQTSTLLVRAPTVEELKANYRTQVETQESISVRNGTASTNRNKPEAISRSENPGSKRCSRGKVGTCYIPAPRYPPKHPEVHRIPLNAPASFGQENIRSKAEESCKSEKKIRNETHENEYQENNITLEVKKGSNFSKSKVKVKGQHGQGQGHGRSTSKHFGGGEPCRRCGRPVYWAEMKLATAGVYHTECFSCCCCAKNLESTTVAENQGEIFCKGCYRRFFGVHGIGYNNTLQTP